MQTKTCSDTIEYISAWQEGSKQGSLNKNIHQKGLVVILHIKNWWQTLYKYIKLIFSWGKNAAHRVTQSLNKHFVPSSPVLSVSWIVPTPSDQHHPSQKMELMGNACSGTFYLRSTLARVSLPPWIWDIAVEEKANVGAAKTEEPPPPETFVQK